MVKVFSVSEPGGHSVNEDALAIRLLPSAPDLYVCAVADGQGGRAGGAAAARLACSACTQAAVAHSPAELLRPETWMRILRSGDEAVADDSEAGFTTLVAFALTSDRIYGASCGDSAAVRVCGDGEREMLTGRQYKGPPIGSGAAIPVSFGGRLSTPWT